MGVLRAGSLDHQTCRSCNGEDTRLDRLVQRTYPRRWHVHGRRCAGDHDYSHHLLDHARDSRLRTHQQREAALALGATRWEMIRIGVLRNARAGIFGAIILGLGRALGETMAVTMGIGNRPEIAKSLLAPGYTMASMLANEVSESTGNVDL